MHKLSELWFYKDASICDRNVGLERTPWNYRPSWDYNENDAAVQYSYRLWR